MNELVPAAPLAAHVAGYWGLTIPMQAPRGHGHPLAPDGCISLLGLRTAAGETRAALIGPRAEPLTIVVNPGDRFWGVRFWPDAGGLVLGENPRKLHGHYVTPLTDPPWGLLLARALAGCGDESQVAAVADEHLAGPVAEAPPLDPLVRQALLALIATNGEMEIAEVARGVGLGPRQLERRFGAATGLTPMQYGRIRRGRPVLPHLLGPAPRTWADVQALPEGSLRP